MGVGSGHASGSVVTNGVPVEPVLWSIDGPTPPSVSKSNYPFLRRGSRPDISLPPPGDGLPGMSREQGSRTARSCRSYRTVLSYRSSNRTPSPTLPSLPRPPLKPEGSGVGGEGVGLETGVSLSDQRCHEALSSRGCPTATHGPPTPVGPRGVEDGRVTGYNPTHPTSDIPAEGHSPRPRTQVVPDRVGDHGSPTTPANGHTNVHTRISTHVPCTHLYNYR